MTKNYIVLDFETAHSFSEMKKNTHIASAVAVGAVEVLDDGLGCSYKELIKPDPFTMDERAQGIHGISLEEVVDKPTFDKVWYGWLKKLVAKADGIIAHNADFDLKVLERALRHYGIPMIDKPVIDTLTLCRKAFPGESHNLAAMAEKFNIPLDHHDPLSDALACGRLYLKLREEGIC